MGRASCEAQNPENTPEDVLEGLDRELKAAVDEALRMLTTGVWQYDASRATNKK